MSPSNLIFVVEDDPLIQTTIRDALEEGGFSVVQATTAEQALEMLDAEGADYKPLITDVNLGSLTLTGWDVARHAREINHAMPVIYMTGDSANEWAVKGAPTVCCWSSRFAPAQVVTAVSHLLNV